MKKTSKIKFHISLSGSPIFHTFSKEKLPTQKAQALLLYLIAEQILQGDQKVSKEKLVDLLWSGMPVGSALQNLRQTIYQIRKTNSKNIGEDAIISSDLIMTDRKNVWISEAVSINSDLDWYQQRFTPNQFYDYPIKTLIALYNKPFLENFHIPNAAQFDEWIEQCRKKFREAHIKILEKVLGEKLVNKEFPSSFKILEQLILKDPYAEQYHFDYIRLLAEQGKRNKGIQAYNHYQILLQEDLGLKPSLKMENLLLKLRDNEYGTVPMNEEKKPAQSNTLKKWILVGGGVLVILLILSATIFFTKKNKTSEDHRIAILPMKNYSGKDYLSDGITDDVLIGLSKVDGIKMISRQSTYSYKDSPKLPAIIGKELNVGFLIKGSVTQLNQHYKVNVQFLKSETGEVLWAESFMKDTSEIFALQSLITQGISNRLNEYFNKSFESPVLTISTQNSEAYNAYLKGRFTFYQANPEALHRAVTLFKKAIELDPDFNLAHAWLAWSYCALAGSWGDQSAEDVYWKVQNELTKIEDDQELKGVRLKILGWMHFWLLDRINAEQYLRQSVSIDPNGEFGMSALGMVLSLRRKFNEAKKISEQALDLNPHFFWNHFVLGQTLFYEGKFNEALRSIENGLSLFDNHQASIGIRSRILSMTGNPEQAVSYLEDLLKEYEKPPASTLGDLGLAYADLGEIEKAKIIADELLQRHSEKEKNTAYFAAKIFAVLKDHNKAIDLLEDTFSARDNELNWIEVDWEFKSLYDRPRFQKLLQKVSTEAMKTNTQVE